MRRFLPSSPPVSTCQILKATTNSHFPQKKHFRVFLFTRQACCIVLRDKLEVFFISSKSVRENHFRKMRTFFSFSARGPDAAEAFFSLVALPRSERRNAISKKKYAYRHTRNSLFLLRLNFNLLLLFPILRPEGKNKIQRSHLFSQTFPR